MLEIPQEKDFSTASTTYRFPHLKCNVFYDAATLPIDIFFYYRVIPQI